ncbi:MAG: cysteine dioxygenase family protein [Flavobacteriales bacterium]|nr:cysteine dioxygenase family protein [Flavobacteriales bacterium]HRH69579.1 cysteine dioxygenase family protein [Flavobacteriales bacterium]
MSFDRITTVRELLRELLRHRTPDDYPRILARYAVPGHDLEPYFRWNTRHYTRTCIHRNEDFELLVICYEPGQRTSIHDYDSQMAWIHPVIGEVLEEHYDPVAGDRIELVRETRLRPGNDASITGGSSIHRFTNLGPERAVTLNLYAKPMRKWRVYNEASGKATITPVGPPP